MSENRPADQDELELTDALAELSCEGDDNLPEEWRDVPGNPRLAVERYFDSLPRYQKEWKEQGLSTFEVIKDASGQRMMKPRWFPNPQLADSKKLRHEVDMEWVTLSRDVVAGQAETSLPFRYESEYYREDPTTHEYKLTTDEWITVPEKEVPKLEEQGWKVWCPPFPAVDPETGEDKRSPAPRPADVITTDNPVADGNHYLRDGFEIMKRMSDNKWKPGDLLDKDGSDPKVKDGLASYTSPSDRDQITDLRSATSTSHLFHHERPDDVCVGWGGYDEFNHWQSCGRRVTADMVGVPNPKAAEDPSAKERVEERKWEDDNNEATEFVNEAGEVVFTVPAYVTERSQHRGRQTTKKAKPRSLYSSLHRHKTDQTAKKPRDTKETKEIAETKETKEPIKDWWCHIGLRRESKCRVLPVDFGPKVASGSPTGSEFDSRGDETDIPCISRLSTALQDIANTSPTKPSDSAKSPIKSAALTVRRTKTKDENVRAGYREMSGPPHPDV